MENPTIERKPLTTDHKVGLAGSAVGFGVGFLASLYFSLFPSSDVKTANQQAANQLVLVADRLGQDGAASWTLPTSLIAYTAAKDCLGVSPQITVVKGQPAWFAASPTENVAECFRQKADGLVKPHIGAAMANAFVVGLIPGIMGGQIVFFGGLALRRRSQRPNGRAEPTPT